jgi:aspartyl/asparaginyl beta-hydroxylase (cupin superfamily)
LRDKWQALRREAREVAKQRAFDEAERRRAARDFETAKRGGSKNIHS